MSKRDFEGQKNIFFPLRILGYNGCRFAMRLLFFFLDGVGLGAEDPQINPFALAAMPTLQALLEGRRLVLDSVSEGPLETGRATLLALDACLGVAGVPQSASGQAALLTGVNVPAAIGYHYGPKPNAAVARFLRNGTLFGSARRGGLRAALLNAYPPSYFAAIQSGRRVYSAIPLAAISAGLALKTRADLMEGQALSADFTGAGWRERLGLPEIPLLSPREAGERMAELAGGLHFAFFEFWLSDYAGHSRDLLAARLLLETFDQALAGLLEAWDDRTGLILITSDHGNLEDLSTRRHTTNPVPALLIGAENRRRAFARSLRDLTDIAPAALELLAAP